MFELILLRCAIITVKMLILGDHKGTCLFNTKHFRPFLQNPKFPNIFI